MLYPNDIKTIYILKFESKAGMYHYNVKYTLLATTKKGELCYLILNKHFKEAKTSSRPHIYYTFQTGGEGLIQHVTDLLKSYGLKVSERYNETNGIKIYNANDFLQNITLTA